MFILAIVVIASFAIFTAPRNRGGVIFSLQTVCLSGSEQNSSQPDGSIWTRFFAKWLLTVYRTGLDPIEFGDLGSKVKVTVT